MKTSLIFMWRLAGIILLALFLTTGIAQAQNVAIYNWNPPGVVKSEDIRIRRIGTTMTDYFNPSVPDDDVNNAYVRLIKHENVIYVRFHNNSSIIIPDGSVTVTAEYAEADPGIAPSSLQSIVGSVPSWNVIGSYVMDLEIYSDDPPDFGFIPGSTYPTDREVGLPSRYGINCSIDCNSPMPISFFLRVSLNYSSDTDPNDNIAYSYYDLSESAPASDIVILHDVSGSMLGELPEAKERAKMFVDILNKGDRVGVVAFSTQFVGDTKIAAALNPILTIDPSDFAKTTARDGINSFTASGATPMGTGVLKAQELLNGIISPASNRAIVMLTDGKENRDPRLKDPNTYPILDGLNTDSKGKIGLYPLWFGTLSHWGKSLLEDIESEVDEGKLVDQPEDDLELAKAYLMIRGILTSDDIYEIHRGITGDGYEGSIYVEQVTNELLLTIAWKTFGRELDIMLLPPGSSSWQTADLFPAITSRGQLYAVHRIQKPMAGQWRYRLMNEREGEPYVLAALADKVDILMQSSLEKTDIAAGEPLVINAKLSQRGKPVSGAKVKAIIEVPQRSLGTILNDYRDILKTPYQVDSTPDMTRASGIVKELKKLLKSDQIFTYDTKTIELSDQDGDGIYKAYYTGTQVAGTYQITIRAENKSPESEVKFQRQHSHAALVSLGKIDPDSSKIDIALQDRVGERGVTIWRVNVIPVDIYGNYIDPGYGSKIRVSASAGQWVRKLSDNDDGSYTGYLQLEQNEKAKISVQAFGQSLPESYTELGPREVWQASIHAGSVWPIGSFDQTVDPGPSFTMDLGYRLSPLNTALFLFQMAKFQRQSGGSEDMFSVSANLRRRLSGSRLSPYLQFGPGLYYIFNNWDAGLNMGTGIVYSASSIVDIEAGIDFHHIFEGSDKIQFWSTNIGFAIHF